MLNCNLVSLFLAFCNRKIRFQLILCITSFGDVDIELDGPFGLGLPFEQLPIFESILYWVRPNFFCATFNVNNH